MAWGAEKVREYARMTPSRARRLELTSSKRASKVGSGVVVIPLRVDAI